MTALAAKGDISYQRMFAKETPTLGDLVEGGFCPIAEVADELAREAIRKAQLATQMAAA